MYKKVSTDMNFVVREQETLEFWKQNGVFEKSVQKNEGKPNFSFYDGPPTANGKPHIGHILTRVMKDIIPRYKTMKGYHVLRKAGWDTHGLPVELEVEKSLGINGKPQIENYGIEPFINECKKSVWKYTSEWEKMSDRVGYWVDMENPYVTYNDSYIESVWWSLKEISKKGLLYKGHKVVPYCPRCGTALSSHEVAQGYKDVTETSVFVRFAVKGRENTYILAWTTTPWTLPSNVALCMNPGFEYSEVTFGGQTLILATALAEKLLGENYDVLSTKKGSEYEGLEYEPLFDYATIGNKKAYYVVNDTYVTLDAGSGVVHIAPAFGEDDAQVGRKYDLPFVQLVDAQGKFVAEAGELTGIFAKEADPMIIRNLNDRGLLFQELAYEHSYPFCWRCDTALLYYARSSWFIRMTAVRDQLMANNRKINWLPENIKEGRMGNFLENVIDWGISRERYWGTPLPVWECECGHFHVIGSKEELKELGGLTEDIELHKPYIDRVKIHCEKCGSEMSRAPEVIDCWYDSGSMPFAQWHYPFENKEVFEANFPADFISEAIDQTRGWFYTLSAISTLLFDGPAFQNCIVLGHVNDKDGLKMSKHKGNVVDPWSILDKQGADAVRWYFYTGSSPWLPSRFYEEAVSEAQRKFMGTLWNTYAFYVLYANIDQFNPMEHTLGQNLSVMDKWVLSRLNSLIKLVDEHLENYRITEAARAISAFVDDLSNWYIRRGRERYWGAEMAEDKVNAFMTLHHVMVTLSKLTAPFVPFMAEQIYGNLVAGLDKNAPVSVHLADFPVADPARMDAKLEEGMDYLLKVVAAGRSCRNTANMKNRQPLRTMYVRESNGLPEELLALIRDELNVKNVIFTADTRDFTTYTFKPQLRTLGPKYGKLVPQIGQALLTVDGNEVVDLLDAGQKLKMVVNDTEVELTKEDLQIFPANKEGFVAAVDGDLTVVLDTRLDEELIAEGYVRELVSKIQTMRKEIGLEVIDHIRLSLDGGDVLNAIIKENATFIAGEVLADEVTVGNISGEKMDWDINGTNCTLGIAKV